MSTLFPFTVGPLPSHCWTSTLSLLDLCPLTVGPLPSHWTSTLSLLDLYPLTVGPLPSHWTSTLSLLDLYPLTVGPLPSDCWTSTLSLLGLYPLTVGPLPSLLDLYPLTSVSHHLGTHLRQACVHTCCTKNYNCTSTVRMQLQADNPLEMHFFNANSSGFAKLFLFRYVYHLEGLLLLLLNNTFNVI